MRETFGAIATVLAFASFVPYIRDILRLKTRPHLYTYLIWTIATTLIFLGQYTQGAGPAAWATAAVAMLTCGVLVLSFKYGTADVTRLDVVLLIIALTAIVPWWLTQNPTLSVILATGIDVCAFAPTMRKLLNDPTSENLPSWVMNLVRHGLTLLALTTVTVATGIYPLTLFGMSMAVVLVIVSKRPHSPRSVISSR